MQQLLLLFSLLFPPISAPPASKGHLEPLFLHNPVSPVPVHIGCPNPSSFVLNNYIGNAPLLMMQAVELHNWTDLALARKLHNLDAYVEGGKKQSEENKTFQISYARFLERYKKEPWSLHSRLPPPLARETLLPYALQCPGLDGAFSDLFFSMASGDTKSRLRYDTDSLLYCQERGSTQVALVNNTPVEPFLDDLIDLPEISASSVDVDRVDFSQFPKLRNLHHFR